MPKRIDIVVEDTAKEDTLQAVTSVGSTLSQSASARTLTTGSEVGTYTNTEFNDATYHEINDAAGTTDIYYDFQVGGDGIPTGVTWIGYGTGGNDDWDVMAYDWAGAGWDTIGNIQGLPGAPADWTRDFTLFPKHVQTSAGADLGKVRIRFYKVGLSTSDLSTNQLLVHYAQSGRSAGYSNGSIWVDTVNGQAGTVAFFNGTADNPVLTWADALTLSASVGITSFHIVNGSTIQLSANSDNYEISGGNWTLDLNGQSIASTVIRGALVSGVGTGINCEFWNCALNTTTTLAGGYFIRCALAGDIVLTGATSYYFDGCFSGVAGTATPSIDFGAAVANTQLNLRHYSGGIEILNIGQNGTDNMSLEGHGQLVLNANCAGGTIAIRGHFTITDNVVGGFVTAGGVISDDARYDVDQIGDACWDEDIVAAHGTASSAGLLLRVLGANISTRANNANLEDLLGVADTAATDTLAGQVWEETVAGHNTVGSMGEVMNNIVAAAFPSVATIADGVWDEDIVAAHGTADTAGLLLRALGAVISQRANNPTLNALLGVADTAGYTIADTVVRKDISAITTADTVSNLILTLGKNIQDRTNNGNLNALLGVADSAGFDIAHTVWDELTAAHTTANSAGQRLQALDVLLEAAGAGDAAAILTQVNKLDATALSGTPHANSVAGKLDSLIATVATIDRDIVTSVNIEGSDIRITAGVEQYGVLQTTPWTQCSAQIFNEAGGIVHNIGVGDFGSIDARGFFAFTQAPHSLVSGQTYQIEVTITNGAALTYQNTKLFKVVNV
jgi:hypothetical protein